MFIYKSGHDIYDGVLVDVNRIQVLSEI